MKFQYRRSIISFVRLLYLTGLVLIFYFVWQRSYEKAIFWDLGNYVVLVSYTGMLVLFMNLYGGLRVGSLRITNLLLSCFFALLFTDFFIYLELSLIAREMLDLSPMLAIFGAQFLLAILGCYLMNTVYYAFNDTRKVVAIYNGDRDDAAVIAKMASISNRFEVVGTLDAREPLDALVAAIEPYDSVLLGGMEPDVRRELFQHCYCAGKRINVLPDSMDIALSVATKTQIFDTPILLCKNRELTPEQRLVKRAIDILFAALGIILTSPVMLIIALAVKVQDGGPVLYKQKRLTLGGRPFDIFKFRSMCVDADRDRAENAMRAVDGDKRVTRFGTLLRPYRLDELPQLFNVLRGDMSIVGPRPERIEHYTLYTQQLPEFSLRLRAKAGLTGYAQIYGRYNTSPRDKLNMDLFYIEDFSILQDIRLMFMTLKILFIKESTAGFANEAVAGEPLQTLPPPQPDKPKADLPGNGERVS